MYHGPDVGGAVAAVSVGDVVQARLLERVGGAGQVHPGDPRDGVAVLGLEVQANGRGQGELRPRVRGLPGHVEGVGRAVAAVPVGNVVKAVRSERRASSPSTVPGAYPARYLNQPD